MKKNYSFNFSSNISVNGKKVLSSNSSDKQKLTSQQEYWMNRILRDYSGKIFLIIVLFLALMFAVVLVAGTSGGSMKNGAVQSNFVFEY